MGQGGEDNREYQKRCITDFMNTPLEKGDCWYLINIYWYNKWKRFVGFDPCDTAGVGDEEHRPGPIDNSSLFTVSKAGDVANGDRKVVSAQQLKPDLVEVQHYVLVPEAAWEKLIRWYSLPPSQAPIERRVIEQGLFAKLCKVEIYLLTLKLCENSDLNSSIPTKFSCVTTIEQLEREMRRLFQIESVKEVRLWSRYLSNTYELLDMKAASLQDAGLYRDQVIVLEQQNSDGTWPRSPKRVGHSGGKASNSDHYEFGQCSSVPGVCGLTNLGNTCFMNSALQCMSNVPQLATYMLSGQWAAELNKTNPLGMHGEIAVSFAGLLRQIWSGQRSFADPRNFKIAVGRFAPQFLGYQQHDSQELMAFLLDGLHEDLNRIRRKPYIEIKDGSGRDDVVVAKESWENYKKRNDSIIVDIFHGLLKSTVQCPECQKISVTFDPFCYLSLPMPVKKEKPIEIIWIPINLMDRPVQFVLMAPKAGTIQDLCNLLSNYVDVIPQLMIVAEILDHRFKRIFKMEDRLHNILSQDSIYIYEMLAFPASQSADLFTIPVYLRQASRYVRIPAVGEKWWTTDHRGTMAGDSKCALGESVKVGNSSSSSSSCQSPLSPSSTDVNSTADSDHWRPIFSLSYFNIDSHYGHLSHHHHHYRHLSDALPADSSAALHSCSTYIIADWTSTAKQLFYNRTEAEEFLKHCTAVDNRSSMKKTSLQLEDCLQLFVEAEELSEHDPWYCPGCRRHQQATKKFDLWMLPSCLIIHLKRFSYSQHNRNKIDTLVTFPTRGLDLSKYILDRTSSSVYDLIAVTNHYGSLGGGHYTAFACNKDTQRWYNFDDSTVSDVSEDCVSIKAGYVLVYKRRDGPTMGDCRTTSSDCRTTSSDCRTTSSDCPTFLHSACRLAACSVADTVLGSRDNGVDFHGPSGGCDDSRDLYSRVDNDMDTV